MEFGLLDGVDGGEQHNGVGFVEISEVFATQDEFSFGMESFDRVYLAH